MASAEYQIAIKIAGNLDKSLNSTIAGAQKSLSALGMLGKAGSESLKIAAGALSAVGAGTAAVGAASVQTGREFEAAMSSAAATAGANAEEYVKLEAAAMEMGRTTSKTASESANALEYMALAGWDVDTSIEALPSVLKASEATGMDLAHCSDMITDSMSAAGVAVGDLSGYLDIATKAQNKSNQTAEALMEAMIGVGGTMKGLNVPIQDTSTALGVLANRGIKGSEAGNALNAVMVNLTTGAGQAGTMMKKLGISAFDAKGNFIGLEATLQAVNRATAGLTQEERNAALAAIGGKTHLDAMNALLAGLNETNAEGIAEWQALNQELWNADGALEEMRKVKLDNLNGDLATFQSALEDTGIRIYKNLQDPLRNAVQFGTKQIYRLSDALQEGGFEGMAEAVGAVLADTLTEIASAVPKFISIAGTVAQGMIRGLSDNGPALTSAVSEMLTQGIMAFADFYADFWTTGASLFAQLLEGMATRMPEITQKAAETVRQLAKGITRQLPAIIAAAADIAAQLIDGLGEALPELVQMGAAIASQLAAGLAEAAPTLITAALGAALQVAQGIATAAPQVAASGLKLVEGIGQGILAGLHFLFTDGTEMVLTLVAGLLSSIPALIQQAGTIVTEFVGGLTAALPAIVQGGIQLVVGLVQGIANALPEIATAALGVISGLAQSLIQNLPLILQAGFELVTGLTQGITGASPQIITAGFQLVTGLLSSIAQTLPQILTIGIQMVGQLATGIAQMLPTILQGGIQLVISLIQGVASNLGSVIQSGIQIVLTLAAGLIQAAPTLIAQIPTLVGGIIEAIFSVNWIEVGVEIVKALGSGLLNAAKGLWEGVKSIFTGGSADAVDTAADAITKESVAVVSAAEGAASAAAYAFQFDTGALTQCGANATSSLATGITSGSDALSLAASSTSTAFIEDVQASMMASLPVITNAGLLLSDGMADAIASGMPGMTATAEASVDTINAMADGISTGAETITGTITELSSCWTGVSEAAGEAWTNIGDEMRSSLEGMATGTATETATQYSAIQTTAAEGMDAIVAATESGATNAQTVFENAIVEIQTAVESGLTAAQSTAESIFTAIADTIQSEMDRAIQTVQDSVIAMRSAMNFTWKLPDLKMPHVSITGKFEIDPPQAPNFSVQWYREGGILNGPQIFGRSGSTLLGGGEAGKEAVLPLSLLWDNMQTIMGDTMMQYANATHNTVANYPTSQEFTNAAENLTSVMNSHDKAINSASAYNSIPTNAYSYAAENMSRQQTDNSTAITTLSSEMTQALATTMDAGAIARDAFAGKSANGGIGYLLEQMDAADIGTANSPQFSNLLTELDKLGNGNAPDGDGEPPMQIIYSPTNHYHFEGDAPSKEDIAGAESLSQEDFNRMMSQYLKDQQRRDFRG